MGFLEQISSWIKIPYFQLACKDAHLSLPTYGVYFPKKYPNSRVVVFAGHPETTVRKNRVKCVRRIPLCLWWEVGGKNLGNQFPADRRWKWGKEEMLYILRLRYWFSRFLILSKIKWMITSAIFHILSLNWNSFTIIHTLSLKSIRRHSSLFLRRHTRFNGKTTVK